MKALKITISFMCITSGSNWEAKEKVASMSGIVRSEEGMSKLLSLWGSMEISTDWTVCAGLWKVGDTVGLTIDSSWDSISLKSSCAKRPEKEEVDIFCYSYVRSLLKCALIKYTLEKKEAFLDQRWKMWKWQGILYWWTDMRNIINVGNKYIRWKL